MIQMKNDIIGLHVARIQDKCWCDRRAYHIHTGVVQLEWRWIKCIKED